MLVLLMALIYEVYCFDGVVTWIPNSAMYIEYHSVKRCFYSEKAFTVRFPSKDTENCTLEYSFQHMPGSLPGQSQQMNSPQPELNDNWTKVSY
jgi:hypothetical protein